MPQVGFGTYKFKKGSGEAERAVVDALELGYRHIDTAFIYGGEKTELEVGNAIVSSNVPREDIFLTTKQWRAYHGYEPTLKCLEKSLHRLQTNYVDLYLIHWPGPAKVIEGEGTMSKIQSLRAETWRAMEDSLLEGKCRAIGVSNFTIRHLEALRRTARIWPPAVNQIELHPYNQQIKLVEYCRTHGIVVQAYASLGGQDSGKKTFNSLGGKLFERNEVKNIARKHGKTEAQILLRWAIENGYCVIPKSSSRLHMQENLESAIDPLWESGGLDDDDRDILNSLNVEDERSRLCWVRDPLKMLRFD